MRARRLTTQGLAEMRFFLDKVRAKQTDVVPPQLLIGNETGMDVPGSPTIKHQVFGSRFRFAEWVTELIDNTHQPGLDRDEGFWAWLSLFFFDEVCPRGKDGVRKVRAEWRYIPRFDNYRMYYRHLLAGPFTLYRAHADDPMRALALLVQPLSTPGELVEQLASRRELATNPSVIHAATLLYLDPKKSSLKPGAGASGPGGPRRLADVLAQFDRTYDLHSIPGNRIVSMLPAEFDRFNATKRRTG